MIYLCRRYILNCRRRLAPILLPILPSLKRRCLTLSDKIRRIVPAGWPPPTAEKGIVSGKRLARLNIKIPIDKQRLIVLISHRTLSFSAIAPIVQKGFHFAAQALGVRAGQTPALFFAAGRNAGSLAPRPVHRIPRPQSGSRYCIRNFSRNWRVRGCCGLANSALASPCSTMRP